MLIEVKGQYFQSPLQILAVVGEDDACKVLFDTGFFLVCPKTTPAEFIEEYNRKIASITRA